MSTGKVLLQLEFRPRENQMPEDAPALLKLIAEDLVTAWRKAKGVTSVDVWASMQSTLVVQVQCDSPESAMSSVPMNNPDLTGVLANIMRRAIIADRRTLTNAPIEQAKTFFSRM